MKIEQLRISGLLLIQLDIFRDERGFFIERFNEKKFRSLDLPTNFVQDNHSHSLPGVLRGLHYQHSPAQGKLIGITRGKIWDVAVDLRKNSPTFGQYEACELDANKGQLFWIPGGFAHGFCVLGNEPADVFYKVTEVYNKETEGGISCLDSELNIQWPIQNIILSERDRKLPSLSEYKKHSVF